MKNSKKCLNNDTMSGKADLHIHTNCSDGFFSPVQIVNKALRHNLSIISITDHDTVSAVPEATEYAQRFGIEVIPGVEISSDIADAEVHILGYFIDINDDELNRYLKFSRDERFHRAERIIRKLNNLGLKITIEDVLKCSGNSSICRPHIAEALLKNEQVSSYYDAFNKYLGNHAPAYEKKVHISPGSAFKIIRDAGGIAIIAHPGNLSENLIKDLMYAGADGFEVIHPSHNDQQTKYYKWLCNAYFLLPSGGSDYHGGKKNDDNNFGKYTITKSAIENMRNQLSKKNKNSVAV